ncbi:MAG: RecX family transcriptional regulator [Pelolinea sp.]|nr:RecX family transcriptional regulator [Pelolinea sp.]
MDKTITNLETQKNDPNRINVYLDDEFAFGISRFVGVSLKQGEKINESVIANLLDKDSKEKALQRALRFINYRPRTIYEVKEKLGELGFEEDVVESVLDELIEKRYLNDREFAENWVASRCQSKPRSHKMFHYELKKKSIPEPVIQAALESIPDDEELALQLGKKYLRRFVNLDENDFSKKMTGILARRAFPFSIVKTAIIELKKIRNELG